MVMIKRCLSVLLVVALGSSFAYTQDATNRISGSILADQMSRLSAEERDVFVEECILSGFYPAFMDELVRVNVQATAENGNVIKGYYYVTPDYLSIGTDDDFIRMPLQPATAQRIANEMGCFLPTKKICDDIYESAIIRLEPRPLTRDRDLFYTFIQHNAIVEGQRKGYQGLIAGHKKDVILTTRLYENQKNDRVALYGWHKPDSKPIQPVYTGHIDWYVDYSHGIRMVKDTIYVEGMPMHYIEVMEHPVYRKFLCDEDACDYYAYPTETNSRK